MATRSRIGMVNDDGTVTSIYCHWDGYPSNNGNILNDHYKNPEKVKSLIKLGNISSLKPGVEPEAGSVHTYDQPQKNITVAYGRDRHETGSSIVARVDPDIDSFMKGDIEEWGYLFKDGKWLVVDGHVAPKDRKFETVYEALLHG